MFDLQSNQYSTCTYSTCTRLIKGKAEVLIMIVCNTHGATLRYPVYPKVSEQHLFKSYSLIRKPYF